MSPISIGTVGAACLNAAPHELQMATSFTFVDHPFDLLGGGAFAMWVYIAVMIALAYLFYKKNKALDFCGRYLTHAFILVWMLGFLVYDMGMYTQSGQGAVDALWSLLGVAPMAIIHAFEMFLLQSDVSEIHDECFKHAWFMTAFSLAHFMAALVSLVFVIKHFGFNIVASIIRYFKTHFFMSRVQDLYVFWGMNDATYNLARNMAEEGKLKDAKIIIIRISNEKENANERLGMERLFSFLSLSKSNLEKLQELQKSGCLTTSTFGSLTNVQASGRNDILRKELRLHSLVRLIQHTEGVVHFFCFEDDEVFNIQAVANLTRDTEIQALASRGGRVKCYCHARYNSIHRVIEDELTDEKIEVKVVDSSHISVELLKKNPALHPVRYVSVEKDATVSSPFHALVVGFSEVGMDAVRFLYEFGAFVPCSSAAKEAARSEFRCYVIDRQINNLAGAFHVNSPAIAIGPDSNAMINLFNLDCQGIAFYDQLEKWIKTLNYVVVATGDDETNISLAVRIFRLAIRYKTNRLEQFRILVRVQHDDNGHIQRIAYHYNRLWEADKQSTDIHLLHQHVTPATREIDAPITLFGASKQIYTFDNVVNEALKGDAKNFKTKYDTSMNELRRQAGADPCPVSTWEAEQNDLMQVTGEHKGYAPTYSGMMKLRRIQSQNYANSLHKETKKWLAEMALGHEGYEGMLNHGLDRRDGTLTYTWKDGADLPIAHVQRVMDVLAQTEHLRWKASHEILGYQMGLDDDGYKDEAKLQHGCLKAWEQLDDITKSYDYNIVDVSLDK